MRDGRLESVQSGEPHSLVQDRRVSTANIVRFPVPIALPSRRAVRRRFRDNRRITIGILRIHTASGNPLRPLSSPNRFGKNSKRKCFDKAPSRLLAATREARAVLC